MSSAYPTDGTPGMGALPSGTASSDSSVGELLGAIGRDLSTLVRQELALAKAEVSEEAKKAGASAGLLGGAGFAGYMIAVVGTFSGIFGLAIVIGLAWAGLALTGLWVIVGTVLFILGRRRLRTVSPKPEQTIQTLKEDAAWARHPTRYGARST